MKLRNLLISLLAAALLAAPSAHAVVIEGVEFAESTDWRGTRLALNGVGLLRYRVFIKGYVAALSLGEDVAPERALGDVPRRLEIEYFWSIPAEKFAEATVTGVSRNADAETLETSLVATAIRLSACRRCLAPAVTEQSMARAISRGGTW